MSKLVEFLIPSIIFVLLTNLILYAVHIIKEPQQISACKVVGHDKNNQPILNCVLISK